MRLRQSYSTARPSNGPSVTHEPTNADFPEFRGPRMHRILVGASFTWLVSACSSEARSNSSRLLLSACAERACDRKVRVQVREPWPWAWLRRWSGIMCGEAASSYLRPWPALHAAHLPRHAEMPRTLTCMGWMQRGPKPRKHCSSCRGEPL